MTRRFSEAGDPPPEKARGGSYPPDIARRRRQCGLPVTPEEHRRYEAGEMPAPPASLAEMRRTLGEVGPRCSPFLRGVLEQIARRQARLRDPGEDG